MAHSGSQVRSAPASPGHAAPLRGVLKRSWPPTPTVTAPLSPLSSPLISHIPLPQLDEDSSCNTSPNMHPHSHHRASIDDSSADSLPHRPISSSPPAHLQPSYTPKVSFDTFENPNATMFSFTLRVKSEGYKRVRSTRVFLCAASPDECGTEALDWCLQSLVQDGDELIVFRGVEQEELGGFRGFGFLISMLTGIDKDHNILRVEARELMRTVQEKSYNFDPNRKVIKKKYPHPTSSDRVFAILTALASIGIYPGKDNRFS